MRTVPKQNSPTTYCNKLSRQSVSSTMLVDISSYTSTPHHTSDSAYDLQNTAPRPVERGLLLRLRQILSVDGKNLGFNNGSFKLQYSLRSGACDTSFIGDNCIDATTASSNFAWLNVDSGLDGLSIYSSENDSSNVDSTVPPSYHQSSPFSNNKAVSVNRNAMFDFGPSDTTTNAGTYYFQAVHANGDLLDNYNYIAEVTRLLATEQFLHHGRAFDTGGSILPFYWGRD